MRSNPKDSDPYSAIEQKFLDRFERLRLPIGSCDDLSDPRIGDELGAIEARWIGYVDGRPVSLLGGRVQNRVGFGMQAGARLGCIAVSAARTSSLLAVPVARWCPVVSGGMDAPIADYDRTMFGLSAAGAGCGLTRKT